MIYNIKNMILLYYYHLVESSQNWSIRFPDFIIIPRFETHIATYDCDYFTSVRHFFNSLLSILAVVLAALIKTFSHILSA